MVDANSWRFCTKSLQHVPDPEFNSVTRIQDQTQLCLVLCHLSESSHPACQAPALIPATLASGHTVQSYVQSWVTTRAWQCWGQLLKASIQASVFPVTHHLPCHSHSNVCFLFSEVRDVPLPLRESQQDCPGKGFEIWERPPGSKDYMIRFPARVKLPSKQFWVLTPDVMLIQFSRSLRFTFLYRQISGDSCSLGHSLRKEGDRAIHETVPTSWFHFSLAWCPPGGMQLRQPRGSFN